MQEFLTFINSLDLGSIFHLPHALAQINVTNFGTENLNNLLVYSTRNIYQTVSNIINIILSFLGALAILFILYGGFLWLTSHGDRDKVQRAKMVIISAVIGILIIFSAYALSRFIIERLGSATGITTEETNPSPPDPTLPGACDEPSNANEVFICRVSPYSAGLGTAVTISGWHFGNTMGTVTFDDHNGHSAQAEIASCAGNTTWSDRNIVAIVPTSLTPGNGYYITVHNAVINADGVFPQLGPTFTITDATNPSIFCLNPNSGPIGTTLNIEGRGFGDAPTANDDVYIDFANSPQSRILVGGTPDISSWSDGLITFNIPNDALSGNVQVRLNSAANISNPSFLSVTCNNNDNNNTAECPATGCCSANQCRPSSICLSGDQAVNAPVISAITPNNGAGNNLVTIQGRNFGVSRGQVTFYSTTQSAPGILPSTLNAACSNADTWTDNYIIIGVPPTLPNGILDVEVTAAAPISLSSAPATFSKNDINRPGICLADRSSGSFETPVTITGINFTNNTGDQVTYGGIPGYDIAINTTLDQAASTVPNLQPGSVGIQINSGTELSNPYPFYVSATLDGEPVIAEIDPGSGPHNQYVTIRGANFGSYVSGQSTVLFGSTPGSFAFPIQCSTTFWRDSQIIVKVPDTLPINVTYPVTVVRSDARQSDPKDFLVNTSTLRPGLCALYPDNGQPGNQVDLIGDNFGNNAYQVSYYDNQLVTDFSSPSFWIDSQIRTRVPENARSGPVRALSTATSSNSLNFSVGSCGRDSDCQALGYSTCCPRDVGNYCADSCETIRSCTYGWRITTQAAPITELNVSDQWPSCTDSCNNPQIGVRFNSALLEATVLPANFAIRDTDNNTVAITGLDWNRSDNSVVLNYNGNLTLGDTYQVSILTGLQNIYNDGFDEPYTWTFTVGNENCQFQSVELIPSTATATRTNQLVGFSATPLSDPDICGGQPLSCTNCQWNWSSSQPSIATVGTGTQSVNAISTGSTTNLTGSTNISCRVDQSGNSATGQAILNIDYTLYVGSLSVINWWPNCNGACINSQVRVDFSSPLSTGSVTPTNFRITDSSGNLISDGSLPQMNGDRSVIVGHYPFDLGQTYTLTVNGAVSSISGATLGSNFERTFSMASNPADCVVSSVDVVPEREPDYGFVATRRNQSILYEALTFGSNEACTNIPIDCQNCSYAWDTIDHTVATVSPNNIARPYVTISPGANNGDNTDVTVRVTDLGVTSNSNDLLSVSLYQGAAPEIYEYHPPQGSINQCLNVAISVTFTELMNTQSLRDGIKVYDISNAANPVAVDGYLSVSSAAGRTTAVFNPRPYLQPNRTYRAVVANTVVSIENVNMAAEFSWTFSTGTEVCRISYATIDPSSDIITCAHNRCPGDVMPISADGNQHQYLAKAYDVRGTQLSSTGLDFTWRTRNVAPNNLLDLVFGNNVDTLVATVVNKNGDEVLLVDIVDGDLSDQINLGQVSVSANITIFLCENPWPDLNAFPWAPYTGSYNYNFSTYYCQNSGINDETVLPSLNVPLPTSPNPVGVLPDGEFIFTVNPSITMRAGNLFGSLALAESKSQLKENGKNWLKFLSKIFTPRALSQESLPVNSPSAPTNLTAVSATASGISLTWTDVSGGTHQESGFVVERREVNTGEIVTVALPADSTSYIDRSIQVDVNYAYRVGATSSQTSVIFWGASIAVSIASDQSGIDIIGIRVMGNPEHLSVSDWYRQHAPNPNQTGNLIEVDGYPALQVGNTTYIAATNLSGGLLYTNIYLISYNVGARPYTQEIVNQILGNFKLNINITTGQSNLCSFDGVLSTQTCSSNFDCVRSGSSYSCDSRGLKLRRDTKRLGDLLSIKKSLDNYGVAHKACSTNAQISCVTNSQCPSNGTCVPYYPMLNAGSFVRGQSNSKWPSWQETFGSTLASQSLPVDPINQFNGCSADGFDPDTCWNESTLTFNCPADSLLYYYKRNDTGSGYNLAANFEYDSQAWAGITFASSLVNTGTSVRGLLSPLSATLDNICNGTGANISNPSCGNGIIDSGEECDGGYLDYRCDATPDLGNHDWWNEQKFGCNPPGTLSDTGALIECRWYAPLTPLTESQCGGYCRDNSLETAYERCESVNGVITYNNVVYSCGTGYTLTCPTNSCQPTCTLLGSNYPAAACGDGVWAQGVEQCDGSANPSGLANWDCTLNGNARCNNTCRVVCDVDISTPYQGKCGDGIIQDFSICSNNPSQACTNSSQCGSGVCVQAERCDYASYITPDTNQATGEPAPIPNAAYTCSQACDFVSQPYCGDRTVQSNFGEICDTNLAIRPTPAQSNVDNQYACRMTSDATNDRCTPTSGGWCGNGTVENGQNSTINAGEVCDSLNYSISPDQSSQTSQYVCDNSCQTSGGWCGNGTVESSYGEACDYGSGTIEKRVDAVFIFDMSASMSTAADQFCDSLSSVINSLQNNNVNFRLTIMPLGDSPSNNLTPSMADNIDTIFTVNELDIDGTDCPQYFYYNTIQLPGSVTTFNTLVPNCTLPTVNAPNVIRVRSFYDASTNDIASTVVANNCTDMTYPATGNCVVQDEYAGNIENWAYATAKIAEAYQWINDYQRIIVPVSDEYAWCGGNSTIFTNDDNYGPGVTSGWLYDAVQNAIDNNIHISPVFFNTYTPAVEAATNVANDTGGSLITDNTGWDTNIMRIVNSAFCDGNGDGIMDCTLPNN
ncbi:MAG: Ig-like domain-containing protein [Patescibacteria group bacterium]